jgi:hypothetical protein
MVMATRRYVVVIEGSDQEIDDAIEMLEERMGEIEDETGTHISFGEEEDEET